MTVTAKLVEELRAIVGNDALVLSDEGRLVYECDMHTFYKGAPDAVVLPTSAIQVPAISCGSAARSRIARVTTSSAPPSAPKAHSDSSPPSRCDSCTPPRP